MSLRKLSTLGNVLFNVLGIIGGESYTQYGGGSNYLCLPRNPKYDKYQNGHQHAGYVYGTEYEVRQYNRNPFDKKLTVHLDGPKSIMGIWWLHIMVRGIHLSSSVSMVILSMSVVASATRMLPCCTLWKECVDRSHVVHTWREGSWHAQSVPSEIVQRASTHIRRKGGLTWQQLIWELHNLKLELTKGS